jgi:hypothetical protein
VAPPLLAAPAVQAAPATERPGCPVVTPAQTAFRSKLHGAEHDVHHSATHGDLQASVMRTRSRLFLDLPRTRTAGTMLHLYSGVLLQKHDPAIARSCSRCTWIPRTCGAGGGPVTCHRRLVCCCCGCGCCCCGRLWSSSAPWRCCSGSCCAAASASELPSSPLGAADTAGVRERERPFMRSSGSLHRVQMTLAVPDAPPCALAGTRHSG